MISNGRVQLTLATLCAVVYSAHCLQNAPIVDYATASYDNCLRMNGTHVCGAVIVSDTWLVTAAQCLQAVNETWLTITGGPNYNLNRYVSQFIAHPDFNNFTLDNDVGLVRVSTPFIWESDLVQSVPVVDANFNLPTGWIGRITGYGPAGPSGNLRGANVTLVSFDDCSKQNYQLSLTESMMCARYAGDETLEAGDAGSALVSMGKLLGVSSQQLAGRPGVYTRLALPRVRSFIQQHAGV